MKLLQDLSDESDSLPPSLYISDVIIGTSVIKGGEAYIRNGSYNGMDVAIRRFQQHQGMSEADWKKVIRPNPSLLQEMMLNSSFTQQITRREIIVHRHLRHENILPLIGVFGDESHPFNIVMPWMHNGVAREYLKTRSDRFFDIVSVYSWKHGFSNATTQTGGAAAGLAYLHGCVPPVIHGDIHSVRTSWFRKRNVILTIRRHILQGNILVDSEGNTQLCDFGLSRIQHEANRT
jgi:serine/threonine protein kinase